MLENQASSYCMLPGCSRLLLERCLRGIALSRSSSSLVRNFTRDPIRTEGKLIFRLITSANSHGSIHTGASEYVVAARTLARSILRRQANLPQVPVHSFDSLLDPEWIAYNHRKRPMFLMGYDGGLANELGESQEERIICQRVFLFGMLQVGLPVALLQATEFKDGKVRFDFLFLICFY